MKKRTNSLDALFNPSSVAVAGASPGKSGQLFLDSILASGFKGKVYAINSKGEDISGLKAYRSIKEVPDHVDYVVCCIPAPAVPQLIRDCPSESGDVAFICQSGGNSVYTTRAASYRGIRFSKVVSYGNACDVNECELLEYLTNDTDTRRVAIYIEGVKDGPRFYQTLTELTKQKPVVVLKGGHTSAGAKAAARSEEHTS